LQFLGNILGTAALAGGQLRPGIVWGGVFGAGALPHPADAM
jgi:hypothetical protein